MPTTDVGRPNARLILPGSGSADAKVEVIFQSRATRLSRAILVLSVAVVVMPVVFFLPPHFLWPLVSLAIGIYLANRYWQGEYYVISFSGQCPRCQAGIELARGTRIRGRHVVECFGCHRQPELVVDDPES